MWTRVTQYLPINPYVKNLHPFIPSLHFHILFLRLVYFYILSAASSQNWLQVAKYFWDQGSTSVELQLHIQITCYSLCFVQFQLEPQVQIFSLPNSPLPLLGYEHRFLSISAISTHAIKHGLTASLDQDLELQPNIVQPSNTPSMARLTCLELYFIFQFTN